MTALTHILFDTDGVLVHAEPWSIRFARENRVSSDMQVFFRGIFQECLLGKADLKDVLPPFLKEWGWPGTLEAYLENWFESENCPDEILIDKIQELRKKGIKCYVATNQEKYRLDYLRKQMKFDEYFDGVFCSAEIGHKKPQREFFEYILHKLTCPAEEIMYFDDSLENIEVSHTMGISSVHYKNRDDFFNAIDSCI